eukprot:5036-Pyramimonas_sp.AAC.1
MQMTDARAVHAGNLRACHAPLAPGAERSRLLCTMLTGAPAPNQLCMCGIKLEGHVDDWTTANRLLYLALMCREVFRLVAYC